MSELVLLILQQYAEEVTETGTKDFWYYPCYFSEALASCQNKKPVHIFYRDYFGRCPAELPNWFHFFILRQGLLIILTNCLIFLSSFLDVMRMSMSFAYPV